MSTHKQDRKTAVPTFPPAQRVGQHLVIDRAEWVPGENPETHLRHDGQAAYTERYFRCLRCGEERLSKRDFPEECPG